MADETKKTTTPKKRTTTSKPKVEEPKPTSIEEQMAQMMAMMMAQQQQLMELMAKTQQTTTQTSEPEPQVEKPRNTKRQKQDGKMTKQDLRRKYKGVDIYVANVSQGSVYYNGKNMKYEWNNPGDIEVVAIEDIINMPKKYLHVPWLCLDGYENEEEVVDDIINTLGLRPIYQYIYVLQDMDENINKVKLEDIEYALELAKQNGSDITMDMVILVDRKIRSGELTNYVLIGQLSELLGKKFL